MFLRFWTTVTQNLTFPSSWKEVKRRMWLQRNGVESINDSTTKSQDGKEILTENKRHMDSIPSCTRNKEDYQWGDDGAIMKLCEAISTWQENWKNSPASISGKLLLFVLGSLSAKVKWRRMNSNLQQRWDIIEGNNYNRMLGFGHCKIK